MDMYWQTLDDEAVNDGPTRRDFAIRLWYFSGEGKGMGVVVGGRGRREGGVGDEVSAQLWISRER